MTDFDGMLSKQRGLSSHSHVVTELQADLEAGNEFTTLDVDCLQLACLATPAKTVEYIYNCQTEIYSKEEVIDCYENVITAAKKDGTDDLSHACDVATKKYKANHLLGIKSLVIIWTCISM